jgi:hypothetical protein
MCWAGIVVPVQHHDNLHLQQCYCENLAQFQCCCRQTDRHTHSHTHTHTHTIIVVVSSAQVHVPCWLHRAELWEQVHPMRPLAMSQWWRVSGGGYPKLQVPVSHRWVPYRRITITIWRHIGDRCGIWGSLSDVWNVGVFVGWPLTAALGLRRSFGLLCFLCTKHKAERNLCLYCMYFLACLGEVEYVGCPSACQCGQMWSLWQLVHLVVRCEVCDSWYTVWSVHQCYSCLKV